jgi:hypothetical protein
MERAIALLRQRGRVTYRTLQIQFTLDDEQLAALKDELLYSQPQVRDDTGRGLIWTDDADPGLASTAAPVKSPVQAPLTYTPPYLAEKILTSRSALEGERKQVTVLFADLKGSTELIRDLDPEAAPRPSAAAPAARAGRCRWRRWVRDARVATEGSLSFPPLGAGGLNRSSMGT